MMSVKPGNCMKVSGIFLLYFRGRLVYIFVVDFAKFKATTKKYLGYIGESFK